MTWKKVYQEDSEGIDRVIIESAVGEVAAGRGPCFVVPIKQCISKRVRITIEEEVKECCEKWRKRDSVLHRITFNSAGEVHSVADEKYSPVYCPECGEKL